MFTNDLMNETTQRLYMNEKTKDYTISTVFFSVVLANSLHYYSYNYIKHTEQPTKTITKNRATTILCSLVITLLLSFCVSAFIKISFSLIVMQRHLSRTLSKMPLSCYTLYCLLRKVVAQNTYLFRTQCYSYI